MVINVGGNCGYCSIEICARFQGMTNMAGFSRGKGGCTASSMARELDAVGVEYMSATNRADSIKIMSQFLAAGKPVLFSIPGHALVCCGWTKASDGREFIWVVD